jgi:hypothetical protein
MGKNTKETRLTPGRARDVGRSMKKGADAVRSSGFGRVAVSEGSFSELPKGVELAGEHAKSYHIMLETMKGFELDLDGYGDAVVKSVEGLENTDADAATMFNRMATIRPSRHDSQYGDEAWGDDR